MIHPFLQIDKYFAFEACFILALILLMYSTVHVNNSVLHFTLFKPLIQHEAGRTLQN